MRKVVKVVFFNRALTEARRVLKRSRAAWTSLWVRLPHPSFFAVFSVFLIGFAHIDRSSSLAPLPAAVIEAASPSTVLHKMEQTNSPNDPWSYFSPAWKSTSAWSLLRSSEDDPVLDPSWDAESIIDDPDGRIEPEFKVPKSLRDRVLFWMNVYSRYSSQIRIVHDRNNLGIIYGYLDFRPIYRLAPNAVAAAAKASDLERKALKELKLRLERASSPRPSALSGEELAGWREILSKAGALSPKETAKLLPAIRTQSGQSDMFLLALHRSKHLLPHIESVFKQNGLPAGLARIPFVESSFNVNAQSKIGAVGIWQFTRETARELIHSEEEKLWSDPLRQTRSAARMLRMYRNVLPDWGTTITSYNSGVGRVRRIVEKYRYTKGEDLANTPPTESLGFAGRNFYSEFLAANLVEAYKDLIFSHFVKPVDFSLVLKGKAVFPNESCDL